MTIKTVSLQLSSSELSFGDKWYLRFLWKGSPRRARVGGGLESSHSVSVYTVEWLDNLSKNIRNTVLSIKPLDLCDILLRLGT